MPVLLYCLIAQIYLFLNNTVQNYMLVARPNTFKLLHFN